MTTPPPSFVRPLLLSAPPKLFTLAIPTAPDGRVLLGRKKTGFGAGYWNGFGGKVEPGESVEAAAARELAEEAGIAAASLVPRGVLTFAFDDQPLPWEVHVFGVPAFSGEPRESEEMAPAWFTRDQIPGLFDQMWADDRHWYPLLLGSDARFAGLFAFTQMHNLLWHALREVGDLGSVTALDLLGQQHAGSTGAGC